MKKKAMWLAIALILLHSAYPATVLDKDLKESDSFLINSINFTFIYSTTSDKAVISTLFSKFIVNKYECEKSGYNTFCIDNVTAQTDIEETSLIRLRVASSNCTMYRAENSSMLCLKEIGVLCEKDTECLSKKCLHGICTEIFPICGDGYCDIKEKCEKDCIRNSTMSNGAYIIPSNKDWVSTNITLKKGKTYSFTASGSYTIDSSGTSYTPAGKQKPSKTAPCPNFNEGALVLLCSRCIMPAKLTPEEDCSLMFRINENALIDNKGELSVNVMQAAEEKPAEKEEIANQTAQQEKMPTDNASVPDSLMQDIKEEIGEEKYPTALIAAGALGFMAAILVLLKIIKRREQY